TRRALEAAERLHPVATSIKIIRLPGLTGEKKKKDVTDWLDEMGHTKDELLRVVEDTPNWEPGNGDDEHQEEGPTPEPTPEESTPLPFINMSSWDKEPVPNQEWAVLDRIPIGQTTLFTGEGGYGKSTMGLHLCAAHSLARGWLDSLPEPGPA